MTIEKLLGMSSTELKAMTREQLEEYFKPYLVVTRPELAPKPQLGPKIRTASGIAKTHRDNKKQQALEILKQHGFGNIKL